MDEIELANVVEPRGSRDIEPRGSRGVETGGRVPPHNLDAERSILGAILVKGDALYHALEVGLESRDFYRQAHQQIFEVLIALSQKGDPVDLITLTAALRDRSWFDSVGGTNTLTGLCDDGFATRNVAFYARIVRDKAVLRRMIEVAGGIAADALGTVEDVEAFLDDAETRVFEVSESKISRSFSSMQDILVQNMHVIEDLAQKKQSITGLATGFTEFDKLTAGLQAGQLVIIAGRPAMGKTSLALTAAQNAAVHGKSVVAVFSLEMQKEELGFRFLSGLSRIDSKRLRIGRLADRDWSRLAQSADQLSKSRIFIDDSGSLSVMDMRARCRRLLATEKRLDLVVVDYLQLMRGGKAFQKSDNRVAEISEISRGLKSLAKELKVPIVALSQLNRGLESRQDKRPMLSDLRESGAIEQDADIVCFVYRDEVYNKESDSRGIAELIVAKHRAGETGMVNLAWLAEYTLFANLATDVAGTPVMGPRPDRGDVTL